MLQTVAHFIVGHALAMLMFSVGLRTPTALIRDIPRRWRVLVFALLVVWLAVPVLAVAMVLIVRPLPAEAGTLVALAICPGAPMIVSKMRTKYGDERTSALVLITSALTALFMLPLWVAVLKRLTPLDLSFHLRDLMAVLLPLLFVPYALGRVIISLAPRVAAVLAKIATAFFFAGLGLAAVIVVVKFLPDLRGLGFRAFVASFLIPICAAVLGYLATPGTVDERVSVTYAAALGNPVLALSVLEHSYRNVKALPLVLAFVIVRVVALIPFNLWFKHRHREEPPRTIRPEPLVPAHGRAN